MDYSSIEIEYLNNTKANEKIVSDLMLKDTSHSCFANAYENDVLVPTKDMAYYYLRDNDMYGIKLNETYIGLLSVTEGREIGIYIEPRYQSLGIGKYVLGLFIEMIRHLYQTDELITEITLDNEPSLKVMTSAGFNEVKHEFRIIDVNDRKRFVKKYALKLTNQNS